MNRGGGEGEDVLYVKRKQSYAAEAWMISLGVIARVTVILETCEGEVRIVSASALGGDLNEAGREFIRTECGIFDGAAKIARLEWISPTRLRIAISTKAN
jgi:hypothetical protein